MKKIGAILISIVLMAICVVLLPIQAQAASDYVEDNYVYTVTDGNATIIRTIEPLKGDVVLPATLGGYPVTALGESAFSSCKDITGVVIPESVKIIGDYAFGQCTALTSVVISDNVTTIGRQAFLGCTGLTDLTIGKSVTVIGNNAFWHCDNLTDVTIPDSVTTIDHQAFSSCASLTNVTIGNSVTSIGAYAFSRCGQLAAITIPDSVKTIGEYAFYNCMGLTGVKIGAGVTSLGDFAFYNCNNITSLEIGNGLKTIPKCAFTYCESLTELTIPESVTSIGSTAFAYCKKLTNVTIPDSVTDLGAFAFAGCDNLQYSVYDNGKYLGNENNPFLILFDVVSNNATSCVIHSDTKIIGSNAFPLDNTLVSITVPDKMTTINAGALFGCLDLTRIYYKGSQEQWQEVSVGADNISPNSVTVVYNYDGCNHVWNTEYLMQEPTCNAAGSKTYTCTVCSESLTKEIEKLAEHSYSNGVCAICNADKNENDNENMNENEEKDTNFFMAIIHAIIEAFVTFFAFFGIKA